MSFIQKIDEIAIKYHNLAEKLNDPAALGNDFAKISKEFSDLEEIITIINQYKKLTKELSEIEDLLKESGIDKEMKEMSE